jgi:hypothetical protein
MNLAHLHLVLNHWPIIGTAIALGLFLVAITGKSEDLKQASLAVFSLVALLAIPAFVSGHAAQDVIRGTEGISGTLVEAHQGAALLALIFMEITGALALIGLWQSRMATDRHPAGWTIGAVVLSSVATMVLMTITGTTGGEIRHPEILEEGSAPWLAGTMGSALNLSVQYFVVMLSRWVWPILEDLHFLGLALLVATTGILNLRLLGFWKQLPLRALHAFIPWAIAGLAINVVTGFFFFLGMPDFYIYNIDFHVKMFAVVMAGATLVLQCTPAFRGVERLGPGQDAPMLAKVVAGSSIVLWVAVVVTGRYLPFFEEYLRP